MSILVINTGSSTLKFALFDSQSCDEIAAGSVDWTTSHGQAKAVIRSQSGKNETQALDVSGYAAAVAFVARWSSSVLPERVAVVGHRVVHGGTRFRSSVLIDAKVKAELTQLSELAPLHNPPALEAIAAAEAALPGIPHIAVFDTAFFGELPPSSFVYPVPYGWFTDLGLRRFGFHGISHSYCTARAAELLLPDPERRLVICHLGNGCSATAVRGTTAIATTMGYTPLEGLMMGTRSGSVDPGLIVHVQRKLGITPDKIDHILNHESGLLGVSGVSSDYRQVEAAAATGHERARLALEIYAGRIRGAIGALAVTLSGVDALVFTAGVGENSSALRATVCAGLECLGLILDPERNAACRPDADVAADASRGRILVLHTREEAMIAREAREILSRA